ncbi:hypothetical protein [Streptococcus ruminantium]|uniref:hypothetical protein n=1 Tax=Streptococcus ruminantium TaxID=1917441 RepID=UPI0012DF694C|nr:hypothetical protein [Streptococcus ruminantium]
MSKCKIASVAILAALSLFATASVSANEVGSNKFINIAPPGGRGSEGSRQSNKWLDKYIEKLEQAEPTETPKTLGLEQSFKGTAHIF